jgi:two-component system phosphate regulon sensor histidine kinase PhoR
MFWPIVTALALVALVTLHLWWRRKFLGSRQEARAEIEELSQNQRTAAIQVRAHQEALFNSMAEGLLLLDHAGRIQLANRAFANLFGVVTDLRSRTIMEALRSHELAELVEGLGTEKPVLGQELKLSAPKERWLEVNGAAIFNGTGARQGTVLVFHDLTRLKQLESARQEFVANVSHELRTPLSLITGYVETLLAGAKDNPEVADKFLHTIERNAHRLHRLIEDLLVISELESGRGKLNLQGVALGPVVQKVFEDFQAQAVAKQVELSNQTADFRVRADADRLEQVLANLVDNAIKYGRTEGRVIVGARMAERRSPNRREEVARQPAGSETGAPQGSEGAEEPGQVEVFVQDDGPGIPPEALNRVFERFYRVDKARSREQGGTGLGLAIVKHIVQGHGGKVWATSKPGEGATFCFTLAQAGGT